jgi:hypothetical protein
MKKSIFFRLTDEEFAEIENYCKQTKRTKSDVLRELIRSLKTKKKPSYKDGACVPLVLVRETSIHKTSGFSSYFFHTLIKQRPGKASFVAKANFSIALPSCLRFWVPASTLPQFPQQSAVLFSRM